MEALSQLRRYALDRLSSAIRHKASGGRVVGYLCDNVPEELITAAGFFPLRISGDPFADMTIVEEKIDTLYPPEMTVRPDFVKAILARLLRGDYSLLDYLIVPHNRYAIQAIYRHLKDAKASDPRLPTPPAYYLDRAWSSQVPSTTFSDDSIADFKETLEIWSGAPIRDDALNSAIGASNDNRMLLSRLARLRAARPSRLSGSDALCITSSSTSLGKSEHNTLLKRFLDEEAPHLPPREGPRIFLGGSPHDHTRVYDAIEAEGVTIVAEDHCWSARSCSLQVGLGKPPLQALAERFDRHPACSIGGSLEHTIARCVDLARKASVDGAIFYVGDNDWAQNWESVDEIRQLEADGIPCLHLTGQRYDGGDLDALRRTIRPFLRSLRPSQQ